MCCYLVCLFFSNLSILASTFFDRFLPNFKLGYLTKFTKPSSFVKKVKVKEVDLYSAFIVVPHTRGAQVRITQCYLQITPYLPVPRKHSPDGASLDWGCGLLLIYLPQKDERLSRPGWLTYSGQITHIDGHPSPAGRAQDSESSPVRDRRSTTVPRYQRKWMTSLCMCDTSLPL